MTVHRHPGRDLYAELGLQPDSSAEDVRRAYRRLARELHPDLNSDPAALARFRDVAAAYAVLSDPVRLADYDATRADAQAADVDPAAAADQPPPPGGVDYVPAGPAVAYTDYVPTAAESWTPPTPPPPQPGSWPPGWPVGRIDPHRGLGPVLLAAWRIAPLPRSRSGKACVVAGVAFVYWVAGPAALALLPAGPRPWVALVLLLIVWVAAACWVLRALTWAWFALTDATHRATARLRRTTGGNRRGPSTSGPPHGRRH
ncbi:J domain-containing protein [Pseudonocardia sp. KRD291]|uniref:J domain-containing protein n=1 Tax=Pseudonocardia sp. KRD291 TaxID=2792007 RepID=UPI001C4A4A8E|nr:J domain-containing protein [Pseudonocardia sp. KRD291]MBW0106079.1 J domain-containing protein [Pseudonocardia sp. KRD291]